jgi:hypothetical protein
MIGRILFASLRHRPRQLALIVAAVLVAAATVSTLASFSALARAATTRDLSSFGPNLTVRPQIDAAGGIAVAALNRIRALPGIVRAEGVAPDAGRGDARGFERIDVRAEPNRLRTLAAAIEAAVEGVEATPLLRISESDERISRRVTRVLAALSAVAVLLAVLSVTAATVALVGERRLEFGLLQALGFTGARINALFAAELLIAAGAGALIGALAGEGATRALAQRLLGDAPAGIGWASLPLAAVTALLVVGSALLVALRRLGRLDAARILRGE